MPRTIPFAWCGRTRRVNIYGEKARSLRLRRASVMFLVENKTKERLELKLELA